MSTAAIVRESTGTEDKEEAKRTLKNAGRAPPRWGQPYPAARRTGTDTRKLAAARPAHYTTTGCRRLAEVEDSLAHLKPFFAGRRAVHITPP